MESALKNLRIHEFRWFPMYAAWNSQNLGIQAVHVTLIEDAWAKLGSIGKPVLHIEARIVDDPMEDMPHGEVGQIVLRGTSVFDGYWGNREATAAAFRDGWFLTGDLGHRDAEGSREGQFLRGLHGRC